MRISIRIDPSTGERYVAVPAKGKELLLDPLLNKGTAFTAREREELDLDGLLPPAISTMKQQLERVYENFQSHPTPLSQHIFLTSLHDRNEVLFYRLLDDHIDEMMPIVYTPVVGEACQKFSHIYRKSRGLYIAYEQKDRIEQILINSGLKNPSVIVVTDGERILGLGDQGAGGMGIPIGKLCLYTLCAGLSPYSTLPIMLDMGTDNEDRLKDPLYLGTRRRRVRGAEYQDFIDAFVAAVHRKFPNAILQWEDFLKGNAIHQLRRFRNTLCTFNDDIQGTAGVVVAGLLSALRISGQSMADQRVLFAGAGASAQGISGLIVAEKTLREKPAFVRRTLRALAKANRLLHANESASAEILAKVVNVSQPIAIETHRYALPAYTRNGIPTDKEVEEHLKADAQFLKLKEPVKSSAVFDFSLQREVNNELGIK